MNTQLNALLIAASALSLLTIGCGELPETTDDVISMEEETLTTGADNRLHALDVDLRRSENTARIDVSVLMDDDSEAFEAWDDTAGQPNVVPMWDGNVERDTVDDVMPMPAGFADGCASNEEWRQLATAVCEDYDSNIGGLVVGDSCGQEQYRLTNFSCVTAGDHKNESMHREFTSILLGDASTCKTASQFRESAAGLCDTTSGVIELKVLGRCDVADDSTPHYEAVRVTCAHDA
jgi:hypothetical protein